jgi:hypothetical protein
MAENTYRLLARRRGDTYRCLLLRDPTPPGQTARQPIDEEKSDPGEVLRRRWLHGIGRTAEFRGVEFPDADFVAITPRASGVLAEGEFRIVKGASPRIELFASLAELWRGLDTIASAPERADLEKEVKALVDAFCCTGLDLKTQVESELVGPMALIQAYLDDRNLLELAEAGIDAQGHLGPIALAVLSGYVFDTTELPDADLGVKSQVRFGPSAPDGAWVELAVRFDKGSTAPPLSIPLAVEQEAEGFYLRLDWDRLTLTQDAPEVAHLWKRVALNKGAPLELHDLNDLSDHTVVVKRSVGPVPTHGPEVLARTPLLVQTEEADIKDGSRHSSVPKYLFVDRLEPQQFERELVHYLVEVQDVLNKTVARGSISVRRKRLDPPPMPQDAKATLAIAGSNSSLEFKVQLPQDSAGLEPVVWFQSRPLDACGFFGTDDDMALEEGLRQADLNFEEGADETEPNADWEGHPVARYLRGAYDKYGLMPVPQLKWVQSGDGVRELSAKASLDGLVEQGRKGARFFIGLRRNESSIESVLRPCEHYLSVESHEPRRIFQIEAVPAQPTARTYVDMKRVSLHALPVPRWQRDANGSLVPGGKPYTVQIAFPVLQLSAVGGFRIFFRDVVSSEPGPFELIAAFEALPRLVFRYRPFGIDSSKRLDQVHGDEGVPETPWSPGGSASDSDVIKAFRSLEGDLRRQPGAPRLVRGVFDAHGGTPVPAKFTLTSENLASIGRGLGLTQGSNLQSVADALEKPSPESDDVRRQVRGHWAVLAPLVDWALANGYARDLVLPLGIDTLAQAKALLDKCADFNQQLQVLKLHWTALLVVADADHVLATARLLVLPAKDYPGWAELDPVYRRLLGWALTGFSGSGSAQLYRENDLNPGLRALDADGTCRVDWTGLNDGWRHQIEVVVEELDRYALVRALQGTKPGATRPAILHRPELKAAETPQACIQRLVVPRLHPEPLPPAVFAVNDSRRVAFLLQDVPERIAASHNLLARTRQGEIVTVVQFSYRLPWLARFAKLLAFEAPQGAPSAQDTPEHVFAPWADTDQDEIEIGNPLFFVDYRIQVRLRADSIEGTLPSGAVARCLPTVSKLAWTKNKPARREVGASETTVILPMLTLGDLLEDDKMAMAARYHLRDKMLDWPDLATSYTMLYRQRDGDTYVPLLSIHLPGYDATAGDQEKIVRQVLALADATFDIPQVEFALGHIKLKLIGTVWKDVDLFVLASRGALHSNPTSIEGDDGV